MRRTMLRLAAVVWMTAVGVVSVTATGANADPPTQQGWWTVSNPGGLPANPADAQADVPSNGLLVQSGPVDPTSPCNCTAYAGLVYELADGLTASELTLKVAPNSATTPVATLEVCPLLSPGLRTEQGGPLDDAPEYDCKQHAKASVSDSTFTFHVGPLVNNGILAEAVLPGDSTSRVVLSKPDNSSLATTPSSSSTGTPFPTPSIPATSPATSGGTTTSGGGGGGGAAISQPAPPSLPQQSQVGGTDTAQQPVVAPSPSASTAPLAAAPVAAASNEDSGSAPVAVILLVAGLAVGAALWALAGRGTAGGLTET